MNPPILKNGNRTSLQLAGVVEVEESTLLVHPPSPALSMAVDGQPPNAAVKKRMNLMSPPCSSLNLSNISEESEPTQLLSLNCFLLGEKPHETFPVKIPRTENVGISQRLDQGEKVPSLQTR